MKKVLLWLAMVVLLVALLLGGVIGAMYAMASEQDLPQQPPTLGGVELEPTGYDWTQPILGGVVNKNYTSPTTLTVQKLGDFGDTAPQLALPDWATRAAVILEAPDGTAVLQGDADSFAAYSYTQNGQYRLSLTLYQDDTNSGPVKPQGWYKYSASYSINLQPKAALSTERASQGDIVAITVTGILDGSTPQLETDLGQVWFRATAQGFMGYIPVTYNAESGEHTLTLTCGSLTQTLTLTVTQASYLTVEQPAEEDAPAGAETEYQNAIWPLYTASGTEKLWNGRFAAPSTAGVTASYGSQLTTDGVRTGRATGITYAAPEGSEVTAPQAGTVVYAGSLGLTGGTVVIDHGCGVKSYLFGLGSIAVQLNQSVETGTLLGTVAQQHSLIYTLRIGSKSVDPDRAIDGKSGLQSQENI